MSPKRNRATFIEDVVEPAPIFSQSLAEACPEASKLWDYKKNCGYGPEDFSYGSGVKAWFKCPRGKDHRFQSLISTVARALLNNSATKGCCFCRGLKASITNNLEAKYPELAREWMSKKNGMRPSEVSYGSSKMAWWKCKKGHIWEAQVCNRTTNDAGCYVCNKGAPIDLRDYPETLAEFDAKKNKGIDPHALTFGMKIFWRCAKNPRHTWQSGFYRTNKQTRCPYCTNKKGSKGNNLKESHPQLARQWHPKKNQGITPASVTSGSHYKVWWKCSKGPDHEWQAVIADRVLDESGCPFCSFRRTSITNVISTVAPQLVREWHKKKNGRATPDTERVRSRTKRWWVCFECGHEWQAEPHRRIERESGCPECAMRTNVERMLLARGIRKRIAVRRR